MSEDLATPDEERSDFSLDIARSRLYSKRQITVVTFLGGPIAGCWLIAENYRAIGQFLLRRHALILGALATLIILILAIVLPENFPSLLLPLIYTLLMDFVVSIKQGSMLERHFEAGGQRHSNWRVFGIGVTGMLALLALGVVMVYIIPESIWVYLEGNPSISSGSLIQ